MLSPQEDFKPPSLLELRDVTCVYRLPRTPPFVAVSNVSLTLHASETIGIVGESGSGKSTLLRAIVGLHSPADGSIALNGEMLPLRASERTHSQHRAIQLVFQNPDRSLNPRHSVRRILTAPLRLFEPELSSVDRNRKIAQLLESVQLPTNLLDRFPHQLSGGEKQRVALARAFAANPRLLLCDEVVSALDVSIQAEVMNLIRSYTQATGTAVIFVTHDLAVVRMMSDRVVVIRNGRVCESATTRAIFESPSHPYTMQLLAAVPRPDAAIKDSGRLRSSGRL
jgi:peptide/nickel transport system ATP-binding protein